MSASILLVRRGGDRRFRGCGASRSLISQAMARAAIHRLTGRPAVIGRCPGGRPVARWADGRDGDPPGLSISYCAGWIGVAVADRGPVGFDIEPRRSVAERVVLRVMSPADADRFGQLGREERRNAATRYWTCAEAVAKVSGQGLPLMLTRSMTLGFVGIGAWRQYGFAVCEAPSGLVWSMAWDSAADLDPRVESSAPFDPAQMEELSGQALCSISPTI